MTKEQILEKSFNTLLKAKFGAIVGEFSEANTNNGYEWVFTAMEEYAQQEVAKERERLEELIKNEPVSFFLVNIMRNLPNEKWPDLINALNERCSLPTKEREKAKKIYEALKMAESIISENVTGHPFSKRTIQQSLTEYENPIQPETTGNQTAC